MSYFPKADAAILQSSYALAQQRPKVIAPILDPDNFSKPIIPWSTTDSEACYPPKNDKFAPAPVPETVSIAADEYLNPMLTRNERLRLTMLWYFTRDLDKDNELLSRLQARVHTAQASVGWEFGIIGLLDHNTFTRLATAGLPLALLPRRESTCAHTVNQIPDTTFMLPNMIEDWRFKESPHVKIGGLRAYAGVPLTLETEFGESVALGSLCVASNTPQTPLKDSEQIALQRLAQWVVADLVHSARLRRQKDRQQMLELLSKAREQMRESTDDQSVLHAIKETYPNARVNMQACYTYQIMVQGREPINWNEFQNGLWEDTATIDDFIFVDNQITPKADKTLRIVAAMCQSTTVPTFLTVSTTDIREVYDDIDAWFVGTCAEMLSQIWQSRMLREAVRAKEKFLRGITHQLRTPLHGILGSVDLLVEELRSQNLLGPPSPSQPVVAEVDVSSLDSKNPLTYLNTIRSSGRDLIAIVNSMLTLNRWQDVLETTRHDELHSFDTIEAELAKGMDGILQGDARYKSCVVYRSEIPSDCDSMCTDLSFLKDCLQPLILNAIQSTSKGVVTVTMSTQDYSKVIIDIEDGGCGIQPEFRERIFEAYEKEDGHSTGAGLGLTLASKFALLLGGSINLIKTELGKGSHFRAVFEDVTFACSLKQALVPPQNKPKILPTRFRWVRDESQKGLSLSEPLVRFLRADGHIPISKEIKDAFVVLDYQDDPGQRLLSLRSVPATQVALCMIPSWAQLEETETIPDNVVMIQGPFLSTTLAAALVRADSLLVTLQNAVAVPLVTSPLPMDDPISATSSTETLTSPVVTSDPAALYPNHPPETNGVLSSTFAANIPERPRIDTPPVVVVPVQPSAIHKDYAGVHRENSNPDSISAIASPPPLALSHVQNSSLSSHRSMSTTSTTSTRIHRSSNPITLIVDDNAINLRIMQMYCGKRRLPFHKAVDGSIALNTYTSYNLNAIQTSQPLVELVLMDLQMPVMDGIEATRQIRRAEEHNGWPRAVILIITGQDSPSDRGDAKNAGADGYFVKPTDIKLLDRGIKEYFLTFEVGK